MNAIRLTSIFAANLFLFSNIVTAAFVTVPNEFANEESPWRNYHPFSSGTRVMFYQQLYYAPQFAAITQPTAITELRFRPDESQAPFSQTIPNVTISLSTTNEYLESSTRYYSALNHGPDRTVVYSGQLELQTQSLQNKSGQKEFSVGIVLETPFVYDPAGGNLLLDIQIPEQVGPRTFLLDFAYDPHSIANGTRRIYSHDSLVANQAGLGLVTQFVFVPEPSTYSLAIAALCFAISRRHRPSCKLAR